jgi:prephenate dehydrogenase
MNDGPFLPVLPAGRRPDRPSVFDRLAIVGLGPAGAAVALAARRAFPSALVIGVDRNDRLETCIRLGAIDLGSDDPIVIAEAELVLFGVSAAEQESWVAAMPDLVPGRAILTSLSGNDGVPAAASSLPDRFRFIAGHLRAAPLAQDIRHASADALNGAAWALSAGAGDADAARLADFIRALGATPVVVADEGALQAFLRERPHAV